MTDPRSLPSAVALEDVLRRGRAELEAGRVQGALRTFDDALRIKPTYAPAWRAKGRALRVAGDAPSALECYAEALRHEPEDEASWFGLALTLHALGRRKEEVTAYEELLRRNPRNVAAWMNKGVALHEAGRYAEALACYDRILSLRPELPAAWSNRGAALLRLGRHEEALDAFDEALAADPGFADAAANRRVVLAHLGRKLPEPPKLDLPDPIQLDPRMDACIRANLGLAAMEAWRRLPPSSADEFVALGTTLLDEGNPEGARAAFAKAEGMGAGVVAALGRLLALEVLRDPRTPEEAQRIVSAFPDVPRAAFWVARAMETAGNLDGALAALTTVVEEHPELAWAWNWKGLLELQLNRASEARMSFEGATAADPDDAEAWTNLAAAAFKEGDAREALPACDRALAIDGSSSAWNNKAVILASLGQSKDAEAAFRKAGEGVAVSLNRAFLAESRRQNRAAVRHYEAALAVAPKDPEATRGRRRALGRLSAGFRKRGHRAKRR